jgi:hypothetical protein
MTIRTNDAAHTRRILAAAVRAPLVDALEPRRLMAAVVATTPFNGQHRVTNSTNINVTFDVAMNPATFTAPRCGCSTPPATQSPRRPGTTRRRRRS